MVKKVEGEPYFALHRFTFRCKNNRRYAVLLEEYEHDFFSIKFYLQSLEHSANKYQMLTNLFDAPAVINTCLNIMVEVLTKNECASFGFTGAPLEKEAITRPTKRYRVYKRIMENLFSPEHFFHFQVPDSNAYFLINRNSGNPQEVVERITNMLKQHYEF